MAIFDGLEIFLEDASSHAAIPEFHTVDSHNSTTVRNVSKCIEVVDGQQCSLRVRARPDFQWHHGDCLRLILDFDAGETVNRYELYLLRDLPTTRQLVINEPVLRRFSSNNCLEATIEYLYIRSDISDEYCQKGRLVFRNLRQDGLRPGGRKTIAQTRNDQGRIRIEVMRLQVDELSVAEEVLLLRPRKRGRTHKEILEKRGIYIETMVDLDGHYERFPRRKFITRNLNAIEGRKQLNFVFEYRKEGVFDPYYPSSSEANDSSLVPGESSPTPKDVYADETQPSIRPRDEQSPDHSVSSTCSQGDVGQVEAELEAELEATTEREEIKDDMVANTGPLISLPAIRAQKLSNTIIKQEDGEFAHFSKNALPGKGLTGVGDKRHQPARESPKSHAFDSVHGPARCQTIVARICDAQSSIDAEQQRIEEDDELHEHLLSSLKETELEYRQARYLQRLEQKRERQTLIARVEALNKGIEEEKRLFEVEREKLQELRECQETVLFGLRKNSASAFLQTDPELISAARPRKRRCEDQRSTHSL